VSHYLEVSGIRAVRAVVIVPHNGRWVAEVDLDDTTAVPLTPRGATLKIGNTTFRGTYVDDRSGTFGLRRKLSIIGGANGWHKIVSAQSQQNDAGIKVASVLQRVADEVGETLANVPDRVLGVKFARRPASAASYLYQFLDAWHVDYDGVTQCRAPQGGTIGEHELLEYDPRARTALVAALDPGAIPRGAILSTRLDVGLIVRSLEITVEAEQARIRVWGT
jgi:hypothetical protein